MRHARKNRESLSTARPRPPEIRLSADERSALALVERSSEGALAARARIILACARAGATNASVARTLSVSRPTVIMWRERFAVSRMGALGERR
jgi:DNA-binding CsgD family transcriptional regulator